MTEIEQKNAVPVLLVEDDPDDVEITKRAFDKGKIANQLYVVRDGEEAMEFLNHDGRYAESNGDAPKPGLLLLDLNRPRLDGRQVLRLIKNDPKLKRIPVVVLTTSDEDADIFDCYNSGANTYMTKPVEFHNFIEAIITIGKYWLCFAEISKNGVGK